VLTTLTVADALFVVSPFDLAVTVNEPVAPGAVYKPVPEIVPVAADPPATPLTSHVTDVSAMFVTVALNCCVSFTTTVDDVGEMLTEGAVVPPTVICSEAL